MNPQEFISQRKEIYTKLLCDLIRAKTVNPPGDEYLAAKVLKKRLSKIGVRYRIHEKKKYRSNVVAVVGNEKGKKVLVSTHLDTVPAGNSWSTDPFEPVIKENMVFGRGASDNKGQAASTLLALDFLKSIENDLKNQYIFLYSADEEQGSALGLKYLLEEKIISPDYALVVDVGGAMKYVDVAEKGILNLKITALGKQAHGSSPNKGVSAIASMAKLTAKLDYYILKHKIHNYLSRPSINFGTISGGSAPNMVADRCEMVVNIRYLPSQTPEEIIDELKKLSERFGNFDFEMMLKTPPTEISVDNIIVKTVEKIAQQHGFNAKPKGLNGATDAKNLLLKEIPAVGFDFADENIAHTANEYCRLDNLFKFSEVLVDICLELDKSI